MSKWLLKRCSTSCTYIAGATRPTTPKPPTPPFSPSSFSRRSSTPPSSSSASVFAAPGAPDYEQQQVVLPSPTYTQHGASVPIIGGGWDPTATYSQGGTSAPLPTATPFSPAATPPPAVTSPAAAPSPSRTSLSPTPRTRAPARINPYFAPTPPPGDESDTPEGARAHMPELPSHLHQARSGSPRWAEQVGQGAAHWAIPVATAGATAGAQQPLTSQPLPPPPPPPPSYLPRRPITQPPSPNHSSSRPSFAPPPPTNPSSRPQIRKPPPPASASARPTPKRRARPNTLAAALSSLAEAVTGSTLGAGERQNADAQPPPTPPPPPPPPAVQASSSSAVVPLHGDASAAWPHGAEGHSDPASRSSVQTTGNAWHEETYNEWREEV